jgi:hypothetical protein
MKFVKIDHPIKVENFDMQNFKKNKHGLLMPDNIRGLIVGPSNCGKTNVMLSMLLHPNGLRFENIYIYSKSIHQPKYKYLKKIATSVKGMGYNEFLNNSDIITPSEAKTNSIFIFDDVACDKQDNIRAYFSMGRHNSVDSFYLCQSYTYIPKHLIRDNANFIIAFNQDDLNLKHIYNDHVNSDMDFNQFKNLCSQCWKEEYGFLVIDKDSPFNNGRYRKKFEEFARI